jgi:uncharacterized membrane protein YgdD (TMEM256/DUF423 family)
MLKTCVFAGAVLGGLAVAAGSFGAHGLKDLLAANGQAANWETGVRYALFHAIAVVAVGILAGLPQAEAARPWLSATGFCFLLGTAIFSGFLGALALSGMRILGAIVPIGGVLLIAGWAALAVAAIRIGGR